MKRAKFAIRRTRRGRSVTINVLEVHRRAEAGTLSAEDQATYKAVFGCEPEELRKKYGMVDAAPKVQPGDGE